MKWFSLFLGCFILSGCWATKNIQERKEITSESISETNKTKDSISETTITQGIESEVEFDLAYLASQTGDFTNTVSTGDDSEFTIEKKDGKLKIRNKTPETVSTETKINESEDTFRYDSDYVIKESKKVIQRIPLKYWIYLLALIAFILRKSIWRLISSIFPSLKTFKIISLFKGKSKKS